ncbi:hypothetical protein, partial [Klebsiella pneumoniae]|uniref:hypothetical protein n=1 Tax=Klebsiella pneumoniae TaxID=573 RepID=UPI002F2BB55E
SGRNNVRPWEAFCYACSRRLRRRKKEKEGTKKRNQGETEGKKVKQATNHPKTRQKRAGSVFTACMSMRASA